MVWIQLPWPQTQSRTAAANNTLPLCACTFLGDKGYDAKAVYNLVKDVYQGEAVIPLNKRNTKSPEKLPAGNPICDAGLAMHKDGKTTDHGRTRPKFCCPFRQSNSPKMAFVPAAIKTGTMGRKTGAVPNTKRFPQTIGFPLTALVSISREPTPCESSANATTHASKPPAKNACGCAAPSAPPTSIPWRISPLWLLLWLLFCPALTPTAPPNCFAVPLEPLALLMVQSLTALDLCAHILLLCPLTSIPPCLTQRFAHLSNMMEGHENDGRIPGRHFSVSG